MSFRNFFKGSLPKIGPFLNACIYTCFFTFDSFFSGEEYLNMCEKFFAIEFFIKKLERVGLTSHQQKGRAHSSIQDPGKDSWRSFCENSSWLKLSISDRVLNPYLKHTLKKRTMKSILPTVVFPP